MRSGIAAKPWAITGLQSVDEPILMNRHGGLPG